MPRNMQAAKPIILVIFNALQKRKNNILEKTTALQRLYIFKGARLITPTQMYSRFWKIMNS